VNPPVNLPPPPPPKTDPSRPGNPATRELPLAQPAAGSTTQVLPPPVVDPPPAEPVGAHPSGPVGAYPSVPVPPQGAGPVPTQPTGPVPYAATGPVEGLTGPPPPAPAAGGSTRVTRRRRDRTAMAGLALGLAAVALLQIGLLVRGGGPHPFWSTVPLWSGFATLAVLLPLAGFLLGGAAAAGRAGRLALAGVTGLAVFWLLVVLPVADTDRGFVLTAALACLGAGLWIAPSRRS
jgi:hypothetical protein